MDSSILRRTALMLAIAALAAAPALAQRGQRGGQAVQLAVVADRDVFVWASLAKRTDLLDFSRDCRIVGDDRACISSRRKILARMKAEAARDPKTSHPPAVDTSAVRLRGIFDGLAGSAEALGIPVLAALHPRTTARLESLGMRVDGPVRALPPLGYLDFLALHTQAGLMITDSGGLQEEACCLGIPCVTLRDNTERPESVDAGANVLAGADPDVIIDAARTMRERRGGWRNPFGDGKSGERIVDILLGGC